MNAPLRVAALLRVGLVLAGVLATVAGPSAAAQTMPGLAQTLTPAPVRKPEPPPLPSLTPAQAQDVLETLNDPKKRAAFAATLEAIVKAAPAPPPVAEAAARPKVGLRQAWRSAASYLHASPSSGGSRDP